MDFNAATEELVSRNGHLVNSQEWDENWDEYYVIFADLIAFAHRCTFSKGVTLNNIIRFHRAITDALMGIENIIKYQFTDACYILAKDAKTALIVASNIQNECMIHNYAQIKSMPHVMFYQMIVPKIVISKGKVLVLQGGDKEIIDERLTGISAKDLLAGEGIVNAYYLEKKTTGGLISVDKDIIKEFKKCGSGFSKIKTNSLYKKWRNDKENKLFAHDGVVDIPWLLIQPKQVNRGDIIIENRSTFKDKLLMFNSIWRMNFTEHIAEKTNTETLKQYGGGISHLCEIVTNYVGVGQKNWDLIDIKTTIDSL